jgi:hypothetical protein
VADPPRSLGRPPGGGDWFGAGNEARILRDRQAALADRIDRALAVQGGGTDRMLVQIYNGGSMPSAVPRVYLGHPILVSGDEVEGGPVSYAIDAATKVPVVVIGHKPSAGDLLVAYLVGGRWVAERKATPAPGGCAATLCAPCAIPKTNLWLAFSIPDKCTQVGTGTVLETAPDGPMAYTQCGGVDTWTYCYNWKQLTCSPTVTYYVLQCSAGVVTLYYGVTSTGSCVSCPSSLSAADWSLGDTTCSPFSISYYQGPPDRTVTITSPGYDVDSMACPVCFTVKGCGGLGVPDCTITIKAGDTVIATGTTPTHALGGGRTPGLIPVIIDIGSPGTYTVECEYGGSPRFDTYSQMLALGCGVAVTIDMTTVIASGYHCPPGCFDSPTPFPDTLNLACTGGGGTLTWSSATFPNAWCPISNTWYGGEGTATWGTPGSCPPPCSNSADIFYYRIGCPPQGIYPIALYSSCPCDWSELSPSQQGCAGYIPWGTVMSSGFTLDPVNITWHVASTAPGQGLGGGPATATLTE